MCKIQSWLQLVKSQLDPQWFLHCQGWGIVDCQWADRRWHVQVWQCIFSEAVDYRWQVRKTINIDDWLFESSTHLLNCDCLKWVWRILLLIHLCDAVMNSLWWLKKGTQTWFPIPFLSNVSTQQCDWRAIVRNHTNYLRKVIDWVDHLTHDGQGIHVVFWLVNLVCDWCCWYTKALLHRRS